MIEMIVIIWIMFSVCCHGFLLDSNTQFPPTHASLLTDNHFDLLMSILNDERQSRIQLENYVKQLEQDIALSKQDIYTHILSNINGTLYTLINDTTSLNSLKSQISQDLNLRGVSVGRGGTAVRREFEMFEGRTIGVFDNYLDAVKAMGRDLGNVSLKVQRLEDIQNMMIGELEQKVSNVEQQLNQMANRVAMTMCLVNDTDFMNGKVIKFNNIITEHGINNSETLKNMGAFTCERTGFYLISAFIQTSTHSSGFQIMKNNERISTGFVLINSGYQTITAVAIEHLSVNDMVYINAYMSSLKVEGDRESCFSIFQVL